jgi:hypothetical protein
MEEGSDARKASHRAVRRIDHVDSAGQPPAGGFPRPFVLSRPHPFAPGMHRPRVPPGGRACSPWPGAEYVGGSRHLMKSPGRRQIQDSDRSRRGSRGPAAGRVRSSLARGDDRALAHSLHIGRRHLRADACGRGPSVDPLLYPSAPEGSIASTPRPSAAAPLTLMRAAWGPSPDGQTVMRSRQPQFPALCAMVGRNVKFAGRLSCGPLGALSRVIASPASRRSTQRTASGGRGIHGTGQHGVAGAEQPVREPVRCRAASLRREARRHPGRRARRPSSPAGGAGEPTAMEGIPGERAIAPGMRVRHRTRALCVNQPSRK